MKEERGTGLWLCFTTEDLEMMCELTDVKIVNYGRLTFLLSEERQNNKNGSVLSHGL
jgi:hypothetical protein